MNLTHKVSTLALALLLVPGIASAQDRFSQFTTFLSSILDFVNSVLIPFILGIGFLVFVWGMFQYFIYGGANDEAKEKGRSLMVYATLGFVLVLIFWGVVNLLAQGTGFQGQGLQTLPTGTTIGS